MAQLNKVLLIGNLTRDPEVRYTPKGSAVCDMGMATNRQWKTDAGEEKSEVCYVSVTVWGKQAEAAGKYLKKGSSCFIEGRLKFESWEKNGEKRSALKVDAERVQFLATRERSDAPARSQGQGEPDLDNDDIPF